MTLDAIALWCASILITLVSYIAIVQPDETAIQLHTSNDSMLASRIGRTQSILQSEPDLEATHQRIVREVTRATAQGRESDAMAFLLHTLSQETKRVHISFLSFTPASEETPGPVETSINAGASQNVQAQASQAQSHSLTGRDISFTVRGQFRSLLDFLPRLSVDDPLVEIQTLTIQARTDPSMQTEPVAQSAVASPASPTPAATAGLGVTGSNYHATTELQIDITARLYRISPHIFEKPSSNNERIHHSNVAATNA